MESAKALAGTNRCPVKRRRPPTSAIISRAHAPTSHRPRDLRERSGAGVCHSTHHGAQLGLEPIVDLRLRETNIGVFEGLTRAEIIARYPDHLRAFDDVTQINYVLPQGESRLMVQNRADSAFQDITRQTHGNVAFVSHGAWIGLLLGRMFPQHTHNGMFPIHNTSISTVALDEGEWELVSVSETPHLS